MQKKSVFTQTGPQGGTGNTTDKGPVSRKVTVFIWCGIYLISIGTSSILTQWTSAVE